MTSQPQQIEGQLITRVWQKWRFSAPHSALAEVNHPPVVDGENRQADSRQAVKKLSFL